MFFLVEFWKYLFICMFLIRKFGLFFVDCLFFEGGGEDGIVVFLKGLF